MTLEKHDVRILVVDDEPYICDLLSRWLTADGYRCESAYSGHDAVKTLESEDFHLVVSDIMMPECPEIDLLTIIRSLFSDVAVIMVTGVDDRKTAIMTLELGAYGTS